MLGSQGGALWDKTNKELTSFKVVINYVCRAVIKRRGPGIFPGVVMNVAPGYFHRKTEEK